MDSSDGLMGRKLWGFFQGSGMFDGRVESFCLIETEYEKEKYGYDRLRDLVALVEKRTIDKREAVWREVQRSIPYAKFATVERCIRKLQNQRGLFLPIIEDNRLVYENEYKNYFQRAV